MTHNPCSRDNINHFLAWACSVRNRYFPYLRFAIRGLFVSLITAFLVACLGTMPYAKDGKMPMFLGQELTLGRIFLLVFGVNLFILLIREFAAQGVLFPNREEINRILNRKSLTAARIDDAIAFIGAYQEKDEKEEADFRKNVLDLIKSNLENYFDVKPADKKCKFSVSIIEEIDRNAMIYRIVARDDGSIDRGFREITGEEALLNRGVEAIRQQRITITDDLDKQFQELRRPYSSVLAIPLIWLDRENDGKVSSKCFASICIDYSGKYRFRGISGPIETNIKPYSRLILFSFLKKLGKRTALEGATNVRPN